jgi:AraC-like DNA-binding protein
MSQDRRGILLPTDTQKFTLDRVAPADDLAGVVLRYWIVRWDLRGQPPFEQETLPFPGTNVVIGTHRPGVHGPATARFVAHLEGEGWVLGTKFRPAGFQPFVGGDAADLVDSDRPVAEVFGADGAALEAAVHAAPLAERIGLVEAFWRARLPAPLDADVHAANRAVELAQTDPAITSVAQLAERAGLGVRTLERLFRRRVGLTPKYVIRLARLHEAAERAARAPIDWSRLAADLGYFDQAHFIRDFKAQIGRTPGEYAALADRG